MSSLWGMTRQTPGNDTPDELTVGNDTAVGNGLTDTGRLRPVRHQAQQLPSLPHPALLTRCRPLSVAVSPPPPLDPAASSRCRQLIRGSGSLADSGDARPDGSIRAVASETSQSEMWCDLRMVRSGLASFWLKNWEGCVFGSS